MMMRRVRDGAGLWRTAEIPAFTLLAAASAADGVVRGLIPSTLTMWAAPREAPHLAWIGDQGVPGGYAIIAWAACLLEPPQKPQGGAIEGRLRGLACALIVRALETDHAGLMEAVFEASPTRGSLVMRAGEVEILGSLATTVLTVQDYTDLRRMPETIDA